MAVYCSQCGGKVVMNKEKVAVMVGGSIVIGAAAGTAGLSGGWIPLIMAAWGGSRAAINLLQAKARFAQMSSRLGGLFKCSRCGADVSVQYVVEKLL